MRKKIVLVGGCFDILHPGHVLFLQKAKRLGGKLIVLLESDKKVKILKGPNRPIHTQKDRAKVLLALNCVDQVINLPYISEQSQYDKLIAKIKPDIIASTKGNLDNHHKQRSAKLVGAQLKIVMSVKSNYSTSKIVDQS